MDNPTEEQHRLLNAEIEVFLQKLDAEKIQIANDLKSINFPLPSEAIGDFGCGSGYTTYSLMSILRVPETIGIDIDKHAINQASLWFEGVRSYLKNQLKEELSEDTIIEKTNNRLGIVIPPRFIVGDVISGNNLPSFLGIAYCRMLLANLLINCEKDGFSGIDRTKMAINNIGKSLLPGGWFIAVEIEGVNLDMLFDEETYYCVNIDHSPLGWVDPYRRYVYRKR
jgi:SAM-dependent methyltransferase